MPKYKKRLKFPVIFILLGIIFLIFGLLYRFRCIFSYWLFYYVSIEIARYWWVWVIFLTGFLLLVYKNIGKLCKSFCIGIKYFFCTYELIDVSAKTLYEERPKTFIEEDEFETKDNVKKITKFIVEQNINRRLIIGLNGKLGIGKTTVMNFIKDVIDKNYHDIFVLTTVNAWVYKDEQALIQGIFSSLLSSIRKKAGFSFNNKTVKDYINSVELSLNINPIPYLGFPINMKRHRRMLTIEETQMKFEQRFKEFPWRAIIFIDDLDRCTNDEIILIFKVLREFLYVNKFIFVVGYDKEKVKSKVDIDIEKYVDTEIPISIEQKLIIKWFYNKISDSQTFGDETKDIVNNGIMQNDFNSIIWEYLDTPRKAKQVLNDLTIALPIIKEHVYFPHFAIITIMRRDIPSLYDFLANGGYWILQKEAFDTLGKNDTLFENEIISVVNGILNLEKKIGDKVLKKKIYQYLDILSDIISYSFDNKGEIKPEYQFRKKDGDWIKDSIVRNMSDKAITNKFHTQSYFIWKTPSYTYSDSSFNVLLEAVTTLKTDEEKIERVRYEIGKVIPEEKFESFIHIIDRYRQKIYDSQLNNIFMQGIARIEKYPYELNDKLIKLAASFIPRRPTDNLIEIAKLLIQNANNPHFLSSVYTEAVLFHSFLFDEDKIKAKEIKEHVETTLQPHIQKRFGEILLNNLKCPFCDFNIDTDHLNFFQIWDDPKIIAEYLINLSKKDKTCADKIIYYMKDLSQHVKIYEEILKIYETLRKDEMQK